MDGLSTICAGLGIVEEDGNGKRTGYAKGEHCLGAPLPLPLFASSLLSPLIEIEVFVVFILDVFNSFLLEMFGR